MEDKYFIFLDVDGVLNFLGSDILDERCIRNLSKIQKSHFCEIVLISTWCELWEIDDIKAKEMRENLVNTLKRHDMNIDYFCYENKARREIDIKNFLEKYKNCNVHYVILDDWEYDTYPGDMKSHQILTAFFLKDKGGLLNMHVNKAIQILER